MKEKFLKFHGKVQDLCCFENKILFVTKHDEGQATKLYCLNPESLELEHATALSSGAESICLLAGNVWVAGDDAQLTLFTDISKAGKVVKLKSKEKCITCLSPCGKQLAVAVDATVLLLDAKGKQIQELQVEGGEVSSLSASECGNWLSIGTSGGWVSVFQCEDAKNWQFSSSAKLHEGSVTSLLFERDSLRFYSSGMDGKLLCTHARGELEAEDRGHGSSHSDRVTSMIHVSENRLMTGGRDAEIKSWKRNSAMRPSRFDKLGKVISMSVVDLYDRPHLAVACDNNTIQFYLLKEGKIEKKYATCFDIYKYLEKELAAVDIKRKEEAVQTLAELNDAPAIQNLSDYVLATPDQKQRVLATKKIAASGHASALKHLSSFFRNADPEVRSIALDGAISHPSASAIKIYEQAIVAEKLDISIVALEAVKTLASKTPENESLLALLINALGAKNYELRLASLLLLQAHYGKKSAEGLLLGMQSKFADTRRDAMYLLYKADLLNESKVSAAIRANLDHQKSEVRDAMWYASLFTKPNLVKALRCLNSNLHRQFWEWENARPLEIFGKEKNQNKAKSANTKPTAPTITKPRKTKVSLEPADFEPLYQALAARSVDISLNAAFCLAVLGERRVLGLLLQLSHAKQAETRRSVCKALAYLSDSRAKERLLILLQDSAVEVRDAAFSGLLRLSENPYDLVEATLLAKYDDVQTLGFKHLLKQVKAKAPKKGDDGWKMLELSLQSGAKVRIEAYKAILQLEIGGSSESSLRFCLHSKFKEVRQEVLTEVMAQAREPWAMDLVVDLFEDPETKIRNDAYTFAIKHTKGKNEVIMEKALVSSYVDVRQMAVKSLIQRKTKTAQQALLGAIEDKEPKIRAAVMAGLVSQSVESSLLKALQSKYFDVQISAAKALAKSASPKAKKALLVLLEQEEPPAEKKEALKVWEQAILGALAGFEVLSDASLVEKIIPFVKSRHTSISQAAMKAICSSIEVSQLALIEEYLRYSDKFVQTWAHYGFALAGDKRGFSVLDKSALKYLSASQQMTAALMIGRKDQSLTQFMQLSKNYAQKDAKTHQQLTYLLDWVAASPEFALASLSSDDASLRLMSAFFIETFNDKKELDELIFHFFSKRSRGSSWDIDLKDLDLLAKTLVHAEPVLVKNAIELLAYFDDSLEKSDAWRAEINRYKERYEKQIAAIAKKKLPKLTADENDLKELAFGTYIGLARDKNQSHERLTALRRLVQMGVKDAFWTFQVRPICLQGLFDSQILIREIAFEGLVSFGENSDYLASQCLESGFTDLGKKGLELLAKEAGKDGEKVLETAMLTRRNELAIEAAHLLLKAQSKTKVATAALKARYPSLITLGLEWLAAELKAGEKTAQKSLLTAAKSNNYKLRLGAAKVLAREKDENAFAILTALLEEAHDLKACDPIVDAFRKLGDEKAAVALLDKFIKNPTQQSSWMSFIVSASRYRNLDTVKTLYTLSENTALQDACFKAILTISGYDQAIKDDQEHRKRGSDFERQWLKEQHPRHDKIFVELLKKAIEAGKTSFVKEQLNKAAWLLSSELGSTLHPLANNESENLRHTAIEALAFRYNYRDAKADGDLLITLLKHSDPMTQFLAAEGIAGKGKAEGLSTLLSAVEFMESFPHRQRAVVALGKLADKRAFDLLLKLASDEDHGLQTYAATALGHLRSSDKEGKVFEILKKMAHAENASQNEAAVKGLRYYDSTEGWQLIRELCAGNNWWVKNEAIETLRFNDSPETKELVLKLLAKNSTADLLEIARKHNGEDSLLPDYAVLKGPVPYYADYPKECLKRICDSAPAEDILLLLAECKPTYHSALLNSLSERKATIKIIDAVIENQAPYTIIGAAKLITNQQIKSKKLVSVYETWLEKLKREEAHTDIVLPDLFHALVAIGKSSEVMEFIDAPIEKNAQLRELAMKSLCTLNPTPKEADWFIEKTKDVNVNLRDQAVELLAQQGNKKLSKSEESLLYDAHYYRQLDRAGLSKSASQFVSHTHYGAVVLDQLVRSGDLKTMLKALSDKTLSEQVKTALIQGMGMIATEEAEDALAKLGKDKKLEEELRQTAWRARRKSTRLRAKATTLTTKEEA